MITKTILLSYKMTKWLIKDDVKVIKKIAKKLPFKLNIKTKGSK
tara:strand:+ start:1436 stop:1567 length:132 start_codon:yes stop_codon:yes gene_type:complete